MLTEVSIVEASQLAVLFFAGAVNLALLIWFVISINSIKSELASVKSRLYDVYDQVFDLRESAQKIEKLIRAATKSKSKEDDEE